VPKNCWYIRSSKSSIPANLTPCVFLSSPQNLNPSLVKGQFLISGLSKFEIVISAFCNSPAIFLKLQVKSLFLTVRKLTDLAKIMSPVNFKEITSS
jgi:hypothetical protein